MDRFSSSALAPHIEPLVHAMGLDLEEIEVSRAGRRSVVRVLVDVDGGVTLDQIADLTQEISARIDTDSAFGDQAFTLEVSSPGVERPLTLPRHWRRNIGRLVSITDGEGAKRVGRITATSETHARIDFDGSVEEIAFTDVRRARIEVEFRRAADEDES